MFGRELMQQSLSLLDRICSC